MVKAWRRIGGGGGGGRISLLPVYTSNFTGQIVIIFFDQVNDEKFINNREETSPFPRECKIIIILSRLQNKGSGVG